MSEERFQNIESRLIKLEQFVSDYFKMQKIQIERTLSDLERQPKEIQDRMKEELEKLLDEYKKAGGMIHK